MMNETKYRHNKRWIIIIAVCSVLLIAGELVISEYVSSEFSETMLNQRKNSVRKMVHLAYHSIEPILDDLHSGRIDSTTARDEITSMVRYMTYDDEYGKNYIFMSAYDGTMLVQPYEPDKEGSNQWDLKDSDGRYIIRELVRAAKEVPGGSFVAYDYYLPTEDRIEEKLSYVMGIPEIGAYIGTGMYVESSYRDLQRILGLQSYGYFLTILFILSAVTFYILSLLKSNQQLSREIRERKFAENNIRTVFDSIHDAIIIHDHDGQIVLANKRAGILFGIPEKEMTKYQIREISSEENKQLEELEKTFPTDASMVLEWKCKRPVDGTVFDGEVALRQSNWSGEEVIVAVVRDISERKKHEEKIRHLAYFDYLTGLHNRVFIMNELQKELDKSGAEPAQGALLFIDLDNFKRINDSFGHFFGDEVLIELANKLKNLDREQYLAARIGGDEFVILCYASGSSEALETAERVLKMFREAIVIHGNTFYITCSIGIAVYPKDGSTVEDLFKNADMALYNAKDKGKDSCSFFKDAMSEELQYRVEMEEQLRLAYRNGEFVLHYQPLFDIAQQRVKGYEALIRWNSPRYGLVMPDRIIPLAEETGLIDKIGDWVVESAFAFAKHRQHRDLYVSCNVSPAQLSQSSFVENILEKFERYRLDRGSVALEITESCLIESFGEAAQKLQKLREKGIMIYLDDFGTGYSSLNYLKNLPVDNIKVDKCFIDEIQNSGVDSKILKTIISLAHDMGIKTVAEGVETETQYRFLELCGCDMVQGYYISKPKPEAEIVNLKI